LCAAAIDRRYSFQDSSLVPRQQNPPLVVADQRGWS
jgi:hypothetical protein